MWFSTQLPSMEKFNITIAHKKQSYQFEVADYLHHDGEHCQFEVFSEGKLVASFEPDSHEIVKVCKNPGHLDSELLHLIAGKLEGFQL